MDLGLLGLDYRSLRLVGLRLVASCCSSLLDSRLEIRKKITLLFQKLHYYIFSNFKFNINP